MNNSIANGIPHHNKGLRCPELIQSNYGVSFFIYFTKIYRKAFVKQVVMMRR